MTVLLFKIIKIHNVLCIIHDVIFVYCLIAVYSGFNASDLSLFSNVMAEPQSASYAGWDTFYTPNHDPVLPDRPAYVEPGEAYCM